MARKQLNIIGAGKLGINVANHLQHSGCAEIVAVCNQSSASSQRAVQLLGVGQAVGQLNDLPPADVTLIATPDDVISDVADQLALTPSLKVNSLVMHCSGVSNAHVLNATKAKGCYNASVHPMKSFANITHPQTNALEGVYCALDGDDEAQQYLLDWLAPLNISWLPIHGDHKVAYHTAGVFASNYLISVAHSACQFLQSAGINHQQAMGVVTHLMMSTLNNMQRTSDLQTSLTGPLARGDLSTIERHLDALDSEQQAELYIALGRNIIELTRHNEDVKSQLDALLLGYT